MAFRLSWLTGVLLIVGGLAGCVGDEEAADEFPDVDVPSSVAPFASAGDDRNVIVGTPVVLSGAKSWALDGGALSHAWRFAARPADSRTTIDGANAVSASFVPDVEGEYVVELTVTERRGKSDKATVRIGVQARGFLQEPDLAKLRGLMALRYRAAPESAEIVYSVDLSGARLPSGELVGGDPFGWSGAAPIRCRIIANGSPQYLCVIESTNRDDYVAFDVLDGQVVNGRYFPCPVTAMFCANQVLRVSPGLVSGTITAVSRGQ